MDDSNGPDDTGEGIERQLVHLKRKAGEISTSADIDTMITIRNTEDGAQGDEEKRKKARGAEDASKKYGTRPNLPKYLEQRVRRRLAGIASPPQRMPFAVVNRAIQKSDSKSYKKALMELPSEMSTAEQHQWLDEAKNLGPNYLGRTASAQKGVRFNVSKSASNGLTLRNVMMPAADTQESATLHASISVMSQGELRYMLAQHLMWVDLNADEFLSHSIDPLFLVVHALCRYHQNQGYVTIQFFDRRDTRNVAGQQADFYPALKLYEIYEVPTWAGWSPIHWGKLLPRKFTQEYLTHGTVRIDGDRFVQVPIAALIAEGLYELFPAFEAPDDHFRSGLYTSQVYLRMVGYPPSKAAGKRLYSYDHCATEKRFTIDLLQKVQKMTRSFTSATGPAEPHLHAFLSFLTFQKRPTRDPVFIDWMQKHYKPADVLDLYDDGAGGVQPGYTNVASNLPGVMQYLDLVRDACYALGLPGIPDNVVEDINPFCGEIYAEADYEHQRYAILSECAAEKMQKQAHKSLLRKDKKEGEKNDSQTNQAVSPAGSRANAEVDGEGGGAMAVTSTPSPALVPDDEASNPPLQGGSGREAMPTI